MRSLLLLATLASLACSTTVRDREVVYVPVSHSHHSHACPCPPGAKRAAHATSVVPARGVRDAVPRTYGHARTRPKDTESYAKKPGRVKPKRERAEHSAHARLPPGQAKKEHAHIPPGQAKKERQRAERGDEHASSAKKKEPKNRRKPKRSPKASVGSPPTAARPAHSNAS